MKNLRPFIAVIAVALPSSLCAATSFNIGFNTDGDFEGFTDWTNIDGPSVTSEPIVLGGFFTGVPAGGDPRIENNTDTFSKLGSETWSSVVFRVRESVDGSTTDFVTTFDQTGLAIVLNGSSVGTSWAAVDSGDNFLTVTADISSFTGDNITSFRIDPVGAPDANNNTFDLDYIELNAVPEPSAAMLGALGLIGLVLRRRK